MLYNVVFYYLKRCSNIKVVNAAGMVNILAILYAYDRLLLKKQSVVDFSICLQ